MFGLDRKTLIIGSVGVIAVVAAFLAFLGSTWDTLGDGTWRNMVLTAAIPTFAITYSWFLVRLAKRETPKGQVTSWRTVGWSALFTLIAIVGFWLLWDSGLGALAATSGVLFAGMVPALLIFTTWTIIAAVRTRFASQDLSPEPVVQPWEAPVPFTPVDGRSPTNLSSPRNVKQNNRSKLAAALAAVFVVIAGLAWVADQWFRANTLNAVVDVTERSERVMERFNRVTESVIGDATREANQGSVDTARTRLLTGFRGAGNTCAVDLKVMDSEWDDISVLPWHSDITKYQDDYGTHIEAWIATCDFYASANDVETVIGQNPHTTDVSSSFRIAGNTARDIAEPLFSDGISKRLQDVFAN